MAVVDDVLKVVRAELADLAEHGITEEELGRGQGQLRGGLVLGLEDTSSRMSRIGKGELNYGDYLSVEQTLARIDEVTAADVAALAKDLLRRPVAAAVVGPYAHADDLPSQVHEVIS